MSISIPMQDRKRELDELQVEQMILGAFPSARHDTAPITESGLAVSWPAFISCRVMTQLL